MPRHRKERVWQSLFFEKSFANHLLRSVAHTGEMGYVRHPKKPVELN